MSKRRVTVDNDHLTVVVSRRLFGLARHVLIVANYGTGIAETVFTSETYYDQYAAVAKAKLTGKQLNLKVVIE